MNVHLDFDASTDVPQRSDNCSFLFDGADGRVAGCGTALPRGPAATLESRIAAALSHAPEGALIGGALPFRKADDDCLWLAEARAATDPAPSEGSPLLTGYRLSLEPSPHAFAAYVDRALNIMERESGDLDGLKKIVLSRTLRILAEAPIPVDHLLARLRQDQSATAFRVALPDHPDHAPWRGRALVGATPELLLRKSGTFIASHPLAGSARRRADPAEDRAAAEALSGSDKDRREHGFVVEYILDTLTPFCRQIGAPEGTTLTHTRSMWHLGTRIEGQLRDDDIPSVVLASLLHPTPAICGVPVAKSAALIDKLEPFRRDFYAGAVGWCDTQGDGTWYVAIRCADICGPHARLFAGAGVVLGSDPMAEAAETGAKFGALLAALGLPADAGMAGLAPQS